MRSLEGRDQERSSDSELARLVLSPCDLGHEPSPLGASVSSSDQDCLPLRLAVKTR